MLPTYTLNNIEFKLFTNIVVIEKYCFNFFNENIIINLIILTNITFVIYHY